jgi:hypothetical protein
MKEESNLRLQFSGSLCQEKSLLSLGLKQQALSKNSHQARKRSHKSLPHKYEMARTTIRQLS